MKRTRTQKAHDLAELLKDRDDARADAAACYSSWLHPEGVSEDVRASTPSRTIFPGLGILR